MDSRSGNYCVCDGEGVCTHSVSHAHFSDTFSLRGVQTSRTRMAQGVLQCACPLHLTLSILMFPPPSLLFPDGHFETTFPTLTSAPSCRTVPDPKARVWRTSARAAESLATWPIPRTPQYEKVRLTLRVPRAVVKKSNWQIGLQYQQEQDARTSCDQPSGSKLIWETWRKTVDYIISGVPLSAVAQQDTRRKDKSHTVDREFREPPEQRILLSGLQADAGDQSVQPGIAGFHR